LLGKRRWCSAAHQRSISSQAHKFKRSFQVSDDNPEPARPRDDRWKKAGLAAAILLAPGGFILGGVLIARALKKRQAARDD
jgi:hypothetical protein